MKKIFISAGFILMSLNCVAQDIDLPAPVKTGGKPLMETLNLRHSSRNYVDKNLPENTLANLLWAAYGFNREDKRTVASSQNRQEIDLYVMFNDAIYLYNAKSNKLVLHVKGDFRKHLGNQSFVNNAPLNLVYVSNLDKASNREAGFIDSGFIAQNVYLYAASEGLGSIVRTSFARPGLHDALNLTDKQEITIVQTIGYTK